MIYDSITMFEGAKAENFTLASGSSFPPLPEEGELFYRNDGANEGLYVYDGAVWIAIGAGGTVDFDGLNVKAAVRVATTANITLSGLQTIDGVSVAAGNRVLVKNQSSAIQNGIYVASTSTWTRSSDFDGSPSTEVKSGDFCFVVEGTTNAGTGWILTTSSPVINSTPLTFQQFNSGTVYTAGPGVAVNGVEISAPTYDLAFANTGLVETGKVFIVTITRSFSLPVGLAGSQASALSPATNSTVLTIYKKIVGNSPVSIGTITFAPAAETGTFSFTSSVSFTPSDTLYVECGVQDSTLADVSITFLGTRI